MATSVGNSVFFHPSSNIGRSHFSPLAICAAIVAQVLPNGSLNLAVIDGRGAVHSMEDVPLIGDEESPPPNGYYATVENSVPKGTYTAPTEPTPVPVVTETEPVLPLTPAPAPTAVVTE